VLVAGASAGLGAAFATEAARCGFDVVLLARREQTLHDTARRIRGFVALNDLDADRRQRSRRRVLQVDDNVPHLRRRRQRRGRNAARRVGCGRPPRQHRDADADHPAHD
jgi:NAD(P)-dependent dehydrogenase (short-subunit alcohol dehydrogenase family)